MIRGDNWANLILFSEKLSSALCKVLRQNLLTIATMGGVVAGLYFLTRVVIAVLEIFLKSNHKIATMGGVVAGLLVAIAVSFKYHMHPRTNNLISDINFLK